MIKFLKRIFKVSAPETKGEVVYGKLKDQVRPCYIPFSKDSGNSPVIATEQYVGRMTINQASITVSLPAITVEARDFQDLRTSYRNAKVGDYVLLAMAEGEANFKDFTLTGFVAEDGYVTARMQNITDSKATFPACKISHKLVKY